MQRVRRPLPLTALLVTILALSTLYYPMRPTATRNESVKPRSVEDHIPFGPRRKRQMARYSKRHYGHARWRLRRKNVIVLHFTAGNSYSGAWSTFASNAPVRGELPGVCAHYLVGKGGRVGEIVSPRIRCRHAIGLNYTALGIEMVQVTGSGSHWAARQILKRKEQIRPTLRLVAWLKRRYEIRMRDIIGHSMVNNSPYFRDRQGWRSTHVDWLWPEVKEFRRRLRKHL
jgi:N-acetyl-anhydromuramyl-L-alanine amidase AmpD